MTIAKEHDRRTPSEAEMLALRLESLHSDVGEIKGAMRELTDAITKLALVEERQMHANAAIDRAFKAVSKIDERVERIEGRIVEIEKALPGLDRNALWVERGVWAALGLLGMYIAKATGLLP